MNERSLISVGSWSMALCLGVAVMTQAAESGAPAATSKGPMPVFILAGQSNMNGAGRVVELPEDLKAAQTNVLFIQFWSTAFKPLDPVKLGKSFGPEVTFGREIARALGRPVGLVKLADGGTSIEQHWNPTTFDKEKGVGVLYQRLAKYLQDVRQANPEIRLAGMIWMQGEADAKYHSKTVAQYRDKLEALIDGYRKESGNADLPFVCGRMNASGQYEKQVREAQESVQRAGYAWFDCDDLAKHPDKLHYSTAGQIELGRRFAAEMLKLLPPGVQ